MKKTAEAATATRGRPATGSAMTSAERKRAQRIRDKAKVWGVTVTDTENMTESGLLEQLGYAVARGYDEIARELADALVIRATARRKDKV